MKSNHIKIYVITGLWLLIATAAGGCKKFLEIDPPKNEVLTSQVFANDDGAKLAINGLYAGLYGAAFNGYTTRYAGFSADELTYYISNTTFDELQANKISVGNPGTESLWQGFYKTIYAANSIIENAEASTGMSSAYKIQAIGEAKFWRAFSHFYLVNLFGKVPLITVTDVKKTALAPRTSVDSVYGQIRADLMDAMNALPGDYAIAGGQRVRANKWAAAALLARVYLYTGDWAGAEAMSTAVIGNNDYTLLSSANIANVFKRNSTEAILQWIDDYNGNALEGIFFMQYYYKFGYFDHRMQPGLLNSFETGDLRKTNWVLTKTYSNSGGNGTFSAPYKYHGNFAPPKEDNYTMLRLAEQYLIRAEARAQQNNISGAQADINMIRNRAGLANTAATGKASLMAAIEQERRVELFCEWGHRWFDLKRWPSLTSPATKTRADDVLGSLKTTWMPTAVLYPIPQSAIVSNPNLEQNDGY